MHRNILIPTTLSLLVSTWPPNLTFSSIHHCKSYNWNGFLYAWVVFFYCISHLKHSSISYPLCFDFLWLTYFNISVALYDRSMVPKNVRLVLNVHLHDNICYAFHILFLTFAWVEIVSTAYWHFSNFSIIYFLNSTSKTKIKR
jgi:hypothetical protein